MAESDIICYWNIVGGSFEKLPTYQSGENQKCYLQSKKTYQIAKRANIINPPGEKWYLKNTESFSL